MKSSMQLEASLPIHIPWQKDGHTWIMEIGPGPVTVDVSMGDGRWSDGLRETTLSRRVEPVDSPEGT